MRLWGFDGFGSTLGGDGLGGLRRTGDNVEVRAAGDGNEEQNAGAGGDTIPGSTATSGVITVGG